MSGVAGWITTHSVRLMYTAVAASTGGRVSTPVGVYAPWRMSENTLERMSTSESAVSRVCIWVKLRFRAYPYVQKRSRHGAYTPTGEVVNRVSFQVCIDRLGRALAVVSHKIQTGLETALHHHHCTPHM